MPKFRCPQEGGPTAGVPSAGEPATTEEIVKCLNLIIKARDSFDIYSWKTPAYANSPTPVLYEVFSAIFSNPRSQEMADQLLSAYMELQAGGGFAESLVVNSQRNLPIPENLVRDAFENARKAVRALDLALRAVPERIAPVEKGEIVFDNIRDAVWFVSIPYAQKEIRRVKAMLASCFPGETEAGGLNPPGTTFPPPAVSGQGAGRMCYDGRSRGPESLLYLQGQIPLC